VRRDSSEPFQLLVPRLRVAERPRGDRWVRLVQQGVFKAKEAAGLSLAKEPAKPIGIFAPEQMVALLQHAPADAVPFLAGDDIRLALRLPQKKRRNICPTVL